VAGSRARLGLDWADLVTLARVPLAALLWVYPRWPAWVLTILALAGLSDMLDGFLARRRHAQKDDPTIAARAARGALLDGLVDKVFALSCLSLVWYVSQERLLFLLAIPLREFLFVPMMIVWRVMPHERRQRIDFTADPMGKLTTVAQFIALLLGYLAWPGREAAAVLAGALGVWATVRYGRRAWRESARDDNSS